MLDLDHPSTPYIFRASHLMDALLQANQKMCCVCDPERLVILEKCGPVFSELNELNELHFQNSDFIRAALAELQAVFGELALPDAQRSENVRANESEFPCLRCGKPLTSFDSLVRLQGQNSIVTYCPFCSQITEAVFQKLDGPQGFGTVFI